MFKLVQVLIALPSTKEVLGRVEVVRLMCVGAVPHQLLKETDSYVAVKPGAQRTLKYCGIDVAGCESRPV